MNLTRLIAIETTTHCNRDCDWCMNRHLEHKHMSEETFEASLEALKLFEPRLIAMNGCGDPLMDPDIFDRTKRVAELGYLPRIITNGDLLDRKTLRKLVKAGVYSLMLSPHDDVQEVLKLALQYDLSTIIGHSPTWSERTHNWAGQLNALNRLETQCNPLEEGWGYINVDGYITQCCLDYAAKYPIGHVDDHSALLEVKCKPMPLCKTCGGSP